MPQAHFLQQLNAEQHAAVIHVDSPLLVLAGAGSGKTRVISSKVRYLIEQQYCAANQIAAITFTNKAANEMRQRISATLGSRAKGLTVSTFHSLGLQILAQQQASFGLRNGFSIFDAGDGLQLIKELLHERNMSQLLDAQKCQHLFSNWKTELLNSEQVLAAAETAEEADEALVYSDYLQALRSYNAVDFDDLLYLPALYFQQDTPLLEHWQQRFRYLLVDEYQDTNSAQYLLLKQLSGERQRFTVVGDDDQSIYAWRGANPENLRLLSDDFPSLKVAKLEQNYRCSGTILKAANQLISNNPHIFDKTLRSTKPDGVDIRVWSCASPEHEAERVAAEIASRQLKGQLKFSDFAILYRSNHQARALEARLREYHVPYRLSGGNSLFDRAEIKDLLAYLRLKANPDDDAAFLRCINTPRREIGAATLAKLSDYAQSRDCRLFSACNEIGLQEVLDSRSYQRLRRFCRWLSEHDASDPSEFAKTLLDQVQYRDWLDQQHASKVACDKRWTQMQEFIDWLGATRERLRNDSQPHDLAATLQRLNLIDMLDRQQDEEDDEQVRLMTLHTAKGLEFNDVFLIGWEEDILPHRNSANTDEMVAEERRLAYVGITRAKQQLTISFARKRKRAGEIELCEPSRFLNELPKELLDWPAAGNNTTDNKRGKAELSEIMAMLKS